MFTPMLHHVHTYVTLCSLLCLHHVHTYVKPCSHLGYTMFTPVYCYFTNLAKPNLENSVGHSCTKQRRPEIKQVENNHWSSKPQVADIETKKSEGKAKISQVRIETNAS